ncbi:MAG: hypothetical protein ABSG46_20455 [Candidatus Binataceae bacterium]|jgi:hypothetical protein
MTLYAGGLRKDEAGRIVSNVRQHGQNIDEVVICQSHTIWDVLNFLGSEYTDVMQKWIAAHAPENKVIHVKWADVIFDVPSRTRGDRMHIVTKQGDRWSCTCEGYGYRGTCWAIAACMEGVYEPRKPL